MNSVNLLLFDFNQTIKSYHQISLKPLEKRVALVVSIIFVGISALSLIWRIYQVTNSKISSSFQGKNGDANLATSTSHKISIQVGAGVGLDYTKNSQKDFQIDEARAILKQDEETDYSRRSTICEKYGLDQHDSNSPIAARTEKLSFESTEVQMATVVPINAEAHDAFDNFKSIENEQIKARQMLKEKFDQARNLKEKLAAWQSLNDLHKKNTSFYCTEEKQNEELNKLVEYFLSALASQSACLINLAEDEKHVIEYIQKLYEIVKRKSALIEKKKPLSQEALNRYLVLTANVVKAREEKKDVDLNYGAYLSHKKERIELEDSFQNEFQSLLALLTKTEKDSCNSFKDDTFFVIALVDFVTQLKKELANLKTEPLIPGICRQE